MLASVTSLDFQIMPGMRGSSANGQFVAHVNSNDFYNVEIDVDANPNSNGNRQAEYFAANNGSTTATAQGSMPYGTHTIYARALDYMSMMNGGTSGAWQPFQITVGQPTPVSVSFAASSQNTNSEGEHRSVAIQLSSPTTSPVGVGISVVGGTASHGADFTLNNQSVYFAPGETSKTIDLQFLEDQILEPTETYTLRLQNPSGAVLGSNPDFQGEILDVTSSTSAPRIEVSSASGIEGTNLDFRVELIGDIPSGTQIPIGYSFIPGIAMAGDNGDYRDNHLPLTLSVSSRVGYVSAYALTDALNENPEHFYLTVSNTAGIEVKYAGNLDKAIGTIINKAAPMLTIDAVSVDEGSAAPQNVHLSEGVDVAASFAYNSSDGTATVGARDYMSFSGTIYFAAHQTLATIQVNALTDSISPETEYYHTLIHIVDPNQSLTLVSAAVNILDVETRGIVIEPEHTWVEIFAGDEDFDDKLDVFDFDGGQYTEGKYVREYIDGGDVNGEYVDGAFTDWHRVESAKNADYVHFVRTRIRLTGYFTQAELASGKIVFHFTEADIDPDAASSQSQSEGLIRIWRKDWQSNREPSADIINANQEYSLAGLGLSSANEFVVYIEGVGIDGIGGQSDLSVELKIDDGAFGVLAPGNRTEEFYNTANLWLSYDFEELDRDQQEEYVKSQMIRAYADTYGEGDVLMKAFYETGGELIVTELSIWRSRDRYLRVWGVDNPTIYFDTSVLKSNGPAWGALELRRHLTAAMGLDQYGGNPHEIDSMREYYSTYYPDEYNANWKIYLAAAGKSWVDAIAETAADLGAYAEFVISFTPAGGLFVAAIDLARPDVGIGQKVLSATAGLLPFVPSKVGKVLGRIVDDYASVFWKKVGTAWQRVTNNGKNVESAFTHGTDDVLKGATKFSDYCLEHYCFAAGTLVTTCTGKKPIKDITIGERVPGFEFETGRWACSEVQQLHQHQYTGAVFQIRAGKSVLETTAYHPFWVVGGVKLEYRSVPKNLKPGTNEDGTLAGRWVDSNELQAGDVLITRDGRELRIEAIEQRFETNFAVYNLTVAGHHTFAVGEDAVLTHNDSWCELVAKSYGKTKTELAQLRDDIAAAWGTAAGSTHGHHIVHKVGAETLSPAGKTANELSQAILTRFKIDIVADKSIASNILKNGDEFGDKLLHNLCIAPYSYVHSDDYVFAVQKMLKWAADSSTDFAKQRERVIRALGDIRTALENGQKLA